MFKAGGVVFDNFIVDWKTGNTDSVGGDAITHQIDFCFFHRGKIVNIFGKNPPKTVRVNVGNVEKNGLLGEGFGGE